MKVVYEQYDATTRVIRPEVELIPPLSDSFAVYGGEGTTERARQWALDNRYLLVSGVDACAHGLYLMSCPCTGACNNTGWADHINLWIGAGFGRPEPFLLSAPYADEVPPEVYPYAFAHGLEVEADVPGDDWYGHGTLPIRLMTGEANVVWPIELVATLLTATQPINWPDDQEASA